MQLDSGQTSAAPDSVTGSDTANGTTTVAPAHLILQPDASTEVVPEALVPEAVFLRISQVSDLSGSCQTSTRYHLESPGGFQADVVSFSIYVDGDEAEQVAAHDVNPEKFQVPALSWVSGGSFATDGGMVTVQRRDNVVEFSLAGASVCAGVVPFLSEADCLESAGVVELVYTGPIVEDELPGEPGWIGGETPGCVSFSDVVYSQQ